MSGGVKLMSISRAARRGAIAVSARGPAPSTGPRSFTRHYRLAPLVLVALFLRFSSPARASDLTGQASVIDGDKLEIQGTRIRLWGIDAPESNQPCRNEESEHYRCGQRAANDLDAFIARRPVNCVEVDRDRYKRAVAVCSVAGVDLAEWLVKSGLALDWPQYSKDAYATAQSEAKRANLGMWSGSFKEPLNYRACRRSGGRPEACSDD
jgi:endonuclease YncB( thermonuclease family)